MKWSALPMLSDGHHAALPVRGMCVLTIHRVVEERERDHDVTWASFRFLLDVIAISHTQIDPSLFPPSPRNEPSVALTFDDGTDDHLRVAEALAQRRMRGIFFIPAGKLGVRGRLNIRQAREVHALGHLVGSHGFHEVVLDESLSPWEVNHELRDSKERLEDVIGARVCYFAPPGGRRGIPASHMLIRHGYEASRSMAWGIYQSPEDRWAIPSLPVTEFTLSRGWIGRAVQAGTLPLSMRWLWTLKGLLPESVRFPMRKILHTTMRPARSREGLLR